MVQISLLFRSPRCTFNSPWMISKSMSLEKKGWWWSISELGNKKVLSLPMLVIFACALILDPSFIIFDHGHIDLFVSQTLTVGCRL